MLKPCLQLSYEDKRGSLLANTNLSADIRLPQLTRESFIDLYPMPDRFRLDQRYRALLGRELKHEYMATWLNLPTYRPYGGWPCPTCQHGIASYGGVN